jgi:hypothetical protein
MKKHNLKNKSKMEDPIVEAVIEQMRKDFEMDDVTAIYELLEHLPKKNLLGYLPEEIAEQLEK